MATNKTTTRVNHKKTRKEKKEKDHKSVEERQEIVKEVYDKLVEVSIASYDEDGSLYSGFDGVQELIKILQEYSKPTLLSGFTGVIKLPEMQRDIEYILPLRNTGGHGVRLVSTDSKKDYQL